MQLYYQTDVSFMTAFLLFLISIIAYFRLNRKDTVSIAYLITAWIIVFVLLIEAYTIIIDGKNDPFSVLMANVLNSVLFAIGPILTLSWFYLIRSMFAPNVNIKRWVHVVLLLPQIISLVVVLTNPWTGYVFSVENGQYYRNELYPIVTIATYLYMVFSLIIVYQNRKTITKQDKILLFVSFTLPMFGGLIQALYYGILTIWPSVAFGLILMYLFLQQRVIHLDFLTRAWTRETFFLHIHRLAKSQSEEPVSAIYFDLDHLKEINDTYGHIAGDLALKKVVEIVKDTLPQNTIIARLGGDEFIALMTHIPNLDLKQMVSVVKSQVDSFNMQKKFDYPIGLSVGYGEFNASYEHFDKFMNHLDQLMYENKRK